MKVESIIKEIVSSYGSSESSRVYMIADVVSGETSLVIEKTITERHPITEYENVIKLHEQLTRGGGRRVWTLKDLTK